MARKPKYYVRPDGLHEAIRTINGKRVAFRGKTDAEVERRMIEHRERLAKGRSFQEVADEWKGIHFPTLATNTLKSYRPALERAINEFGERLVNEIKPPEVKRFINEFARGGRSLKTVERQLYVASMVFDHAVSEGEIDYNPCVSISPPKGLQSGHRDAASPEDEEKIKTAADVWLLPYLIYYTGLRKGEALALTYGDIDLDGREIRVNKSVYFVSNNPHIKTPKTEAGKRTVPIFDPLLAELPTDGAPGDYLFSDDGGKSPLTHRRFEMCWRKFVEVTGISCTAHQLRHSYATMLYDLDVDSKVAQALLGHATEAMTREVYTHLRPDKFKTATDEINKRLVGAADTLSTQ